MMNQKIVETFALIGDEVQDREIKFELTEPGTTYELYGIYYLTEGQNSTIRTKIIHQAKNCESKIRIIGVIQGEKAKFDWSGDVVIEKNAVNSKTYEENRNLVIGKGPKVISIPNLEIKNGDIIGAGHASATGKIDQDELFYLQSKGIELNEAKKMIMLGFLQDQLDLINNPEISEKFSEIFNSSL